MQRYVGQKLGTSEWVVVDQEKIDAFARLTGDDNWIHVDRDRAARELPHGKTIAHGLLTLSLMPRLAAQTLKIRALAQHQLRLEQDSLSRAGQMRVARAPAPQSRE